MSTTSAPSIRNPGPSGNSRRRPVRSSSSTSPDATPTTAPQKPSVGHLDDEVADASTLGSGRGVPLPPAGREHVGAVAIVHVSSEIGKATGGRARASAAATRTSQHPAHALPCPAPGLHRLASGPRSARPRGEAIDACAMGGGAHGGPRRLLLAGAAGAASRDRPRDRSARATCSTTPACSSAAEEAQAENRLAAAQDRHRARPVGRLVDEFTEPVRAPRTGRTRPPRSTASGRRSTCWPSRPKPASSTSRATPTGPVTPEQLGDDRAAADPARARRRRLARRGRRRGGRPRPMPRAADPAAATARPAAASSSASSSSS